MKKTTNKSNKFKWLLTGAIALNIALTGVSTAGATGQSTKVSNEQKPSPQVFYNTLTQSLKNFDSEINFTNFTQYGVASTTTVEDYIEMAYYQTPLAIGVGSYGFSQKVTDNYSVGFRFHEEAKNLKLKQAKVLEEANKVVKSKITAKMTAEEKSKAIYDYLVQTVAYDNALLKSMQSGKASYTDSFNAYGALVNKKAVCQGFSGAFKIMADIAGLENTIVTGYAQGVPHAWNKVKINNEWVNIDPTNNANTTGIPYFLFMGSDDLAKSLNYKEDTLYALDKDIKAGVYNTPKTTSDYYVKNKLIVSDVNQFKTLVQSQLKSNKNQMTFAYRLTNGVTAKAISTEAYTQLEKAKGAQFMKQHSLTYATLGSYVTLELNKK